MKRLPFALCVALACLSWCVASQEPHQESPGEETGGSYEATIENNLGAHQGRKDYWHTHSNLKKCHIKIRGDRTGTVYAYDRANQKWIKESDLDAAGTARIQGRNCDVYKIRQVGADEYYAFSTTPVRSDGGVEYYAMYYRKNKGLWERIRTPSWTEGIRALAAGGNGE
jgi:hypothetical protein